MIIEHAGREYDTAEAPRWVPLVAISLAVSRLPATETPEALAADLAPWAQRMAAMYDCPPEGAGWIAAVALAEFADRKAGQRMVQAYAARFGV